MMEQVTGLPYEVRITSAENGYVVYVGCKSFVFMKRSHMLAKLEDYLTAPGDMVKQWAPDSLCAPDCEPMEDDGARCVAPGRPLNGSIGAPAQGRAS